MADKTTYTIRLDSREHRLLIHLAKVLGTSAADLSREIMSAGIHKLLDPDEIDRRMEEERLRLRAEAEKILATVEATELANQPARPSRRKSTQKHEPSDRSDSDEDTDVADVVHAATARAGTDD